ncbi:hypothetical protein LXL04_015399 [Taraxacum kok-saghyz]
MDVKISFLNGVLNGETYMSPPIGISHQLGKALPTLPKPIRVWKGATLRYQLLQNQLVFGNGLPCTYSAFNPLAPTTFDFNQLGLHAGTELFLTQQLLLLFFNLAIVILLYLLDVQMQVNSVFAYMLMTISLLLLKSPKGYLLFKTKYITYLFERTLLMDNQTISMDNQTIDMPLESNAKYTATDCVPKSDPHFIVPLLDIAHAVHVVSQFFTSPSTVYWELYLCGSFTALCFLQRCLLICVPMVMLIEIVMFIIASPLLGVNLSIKLWLSSHVILFGCDDFLHIWLFICLILSPLYCDNESVILIARNLLFHERTNNISFFVSHVPSTLQIADMFTKPLTIS